MATACATQMSGLTLHDKEALYEDYLDTAGKFQPFEHEGIRWVGMLPLDKKVMRLIGGEWKCTTCIHNVNTISRMFGADGQGLCTHHGDKTSHQLSVERNVLKRIASMKAFTGRCWTIKILPPNGLTPQEGDLSNFYNKTTYDGKIFNHYFINSVKSDEGVDYQKIQSVFDKYTILVFDMLSKFAATDWEAISNSFEMIQSITEEAPYAGPKLKPGIDWMNGIIAHVKSYGKSCFNHLSVLEKVDVVGKAIASSSISEGPTITAFHLVNNNILDLIANAKSRKSMIQMCKDRFDPRKHCIKTGELKAGAIKQTMATLGDWKTSIMTVDDLTSDMVPGVVTLSNHGGGGGGSGSMTTMSGLLEKKNTKSKYDFSSRVAKPFFKGNPTNVKALMDMINSGEITKLEIDSSNMDTTYIGKFDGLDPKYLITGGPWSWGFLSGHSARFFGKVEVTHIAPMKGAGYDNALFVVKGGRNVRKITGNIRWPNTLTSDIMRTCGGTFQRVQESTNVEYPPGNSELAIGLGVSSSDSNKKLTHSIRVYINGRAESNTIYYISE
jgi:hypothetical protein